jgi:hypothetical protein
LAQRRKRAAAAVGDGSRLLEGHLCGYPRDGAARLHADVLGIRPALDAEDAVTGRELLDLTADGHDLAGELHPDDGLLRSEQAREEPDEERRRDA